MLHKNMKKPAEKFVAESFFEKVEASLKLQQS